jgi:hypothetical protein
MTSHWETECGPPRAHEALETPAGRSSSEKAESGEGGGVVSEPASAALRLKRSCDGLEVGERRGEILDDLASENVRRWQFAGIFE